MDTLGKLFGSNAIVKILRLFLFNPTEPFETKDVIKRTKVNPDTARIEISMLERIKFIKRKSFYKDVQHKRGKQLEWKRKRVYGWILDERFVYLAPLRDFFQSTAIQDTNELLNHLQKIGKLKLVITAGVFLQNWDARVDLLIVGDSLKLPKLEQTIKDIEAEMGRELRYTALTSDDFVYRMSMRDRLLRDILDFPHEKILNKLTII